MMMTEQNDLVVIGAGWYGLAAAHTYMELHPTHRIVVLEASSSCGGTWASDRIYPGLKSNNLLDAYEYPDFPMSETLYDVKAHRPIPGAAIHKYLSDFAKQTGVLERMQFQTQVKALEQTADGGWKLDVVRNDSSTSSIQTRKVILATGLTSEPNMPTFKGAESFGAPIFHAKDFANRAYTMAGIKSACVVGGAKSAFDVAYAYVENGSTVDMVIRPDGNGPIWISHPWVMGGKKRLEKLLHTRFLTWFSPCPWDAEDGFSWPKRLLHGTAIGRWIVDKFWGLLAADVIQANGYDRHSETKKLKPWNAAFWIGSGLSIYNHDQDFLQLVADGKIRVHIARVDLLSNHAVHLSNGRTIEADTLICSTGWRRSPTIDFKGVNIGLPQSPAAQTKLISDADTELLKKFPRLANQPSLNFTPENDPFRLYRFMVPPAYVNLRNIAFAGMVSSVSTSMFASVQALWISAFFDGKLDRLATSEAEVTHEVLLHTQWGKWRYPTGYGASHPDFAFDGIPYIDLLLNDLGLQVRRKSGLFREVSEPYGPPDYRGLLDEWGSKH